MDKHIFIYGLNGYAKKIVKALSKAETVSERNKILLPFTSRPSVAVIINQKDSRTFYRPKLGLNIIAFRAEENYTAIPEFKTADEALTEAIFIANEIKTQHSISQMHKSNARKELSQRLIKLNNDRVTVASEVNLAAETLDDVTHRQKMTQLGFIDMEIAFIEKTLQS